MYIYRLTLILYWSKPQRKKVKENIHIECRKLKNTKKYT